MIRRILFIALYTRAHAHEAAVDTENESPRICASHVAKALRDAAQAEAGSTEAGSTGGSRPDQASEELDTRSASLMGTTPARHVADESRAPLTERVIDALADRATDRIVDDLLDASGLFTEPLPSYARQRQ
jgi:hypothetical protein